MLKLLALSAASYALADCTVDSCVFSYQPASSNVCGEVDASQFMPKALFDYPTSLAQYVILTTQLVYGGMDLEFNLEQKPCDHTNRKNMNTTISWAPYEHNSILYVCKAACNCIFPDDAYHPPGQPDTCKDAPDDPEAGHFCSLCGPIFNPTNVPLTFWYDKAKPEELKTALENAGRNITIDTPTISPVKTNRVADPPQPNLLELAAATPELSILAELVQKANLSDALSNLTSRYTIFAPTNEAFSGLPTPTFDLLMNPDTDVGLLQSVILTHVLGYEVPTEAWIDRGVLQMLAYDIRMLGENHYSAGYTIDHAQLLKYDIYASNGVVHVIDRVLMPYLFKWPGPKA